MKRAAWLAAVLLLGGCATTQPPLRSEPVEVAGVPFFPQTDYQCGPAALATVLTDSGAAVEPADITGAVYIPDRKGSLQVELLAAARRYGRLPFVIPPTTDALLAELEAGRPVLVLQNLAFARFPKWHYAVVIGYEPGTNRFLLRSGRTERKRERTSMFLRSWELADRWGLVVVGPGELPASATADAWARTVAASESLIDAELAMAAYEVGLARWSEDPLLLFAGANYHFGSGRDEEAYALYRRLLAVEPGHAAARNNLANLLLERGCVDRAEVEIEHALADLATDDPLAPALRDTEAQIAAAGAEAGGGVCELNP